MHFIFLKFQRFFGVLISILALPLLIVPLVPVFGFALTAVGSLLVLLLVLQKLFAKEELSFPNSGLLELLVAAPVFLILKRATAQWSEFYNIGEHIRDFAVLSAVMRDPIATKESWLDSLNLFYYSYWYRFGYVIKEIFRLTTAETYHFLISFSLTLLFVVLIRVSRVVFKRSWNGSILIGVIATFGSNVLGIATASQDGFWWGPSRAVRPGITEFPAWSFILGDLHPHYLSLIFLPCALLLVGEIDTLNRSIKKLALPAVTILLLLVSVVYGANSWDVVGFAILTPPVLLAIYLSSKPMLNAKEKASDFSLLGFVFCISMSKLALRLAPKFGESPLSLSLVTKDAPKVELFEFFNHWGWQLLFISAGLLISLTEKSILPNFFVVCVAIAVIFYSNSTLITLSVVLSLILYNSVYKKQFTISASLCVGAILVLIFTELFFFDDSYTGINERLNTIFKYYYFCWIPLSVGAVVFICEQIQKLPSPFRTKNILIPIGVTFAAILISFFAQVAFGKGERKVVLPGYIEPRIEGLSSIENESPGSAKVIRKLRTLSPNVRVLEDAEPAYSSSANRCSLSEHNCYIGWRNHLQLQYTHGLEEYDRRELVSKNIYSKISCQRKRELCIFENIGAVIVGPRERQKNPNLVRADFSCFSQISDYGQFTVFQP